MKPNCETNASITNSSDHKNWSIDKLLVSFHFQPNLSKKKFSASVHYVALINECHFKTTIIVNTQKY